jgi:hypothetical protein
LGSTGSEQESVVGFCEHVTQFGILYGVEIINALSAYWLFEKARTLQIWLMRKAKNKGILNH